MPVSLGKALERLGLPGALIRTKRLDAIASKDAMEGLARTQLPVPLYSSSDYGVSAYLSLVCSVYLLKTVARMQITSHLTQSTTRCYYSRKEGNKNERICPNGRSLSDDAKGTVWPIRSPLFGSGCYFKPLNVCSCLFPQSMRI